jgi:hypothetical protein
MNPVDSRVQIQEELLLAKQSRKEGNEGRARVCARRAAGAAAQIFLDPQGVNKNSNNAFQALITLQEKVVLPVRIQLAVTRLTQRVNEDHQLPPEIDLIQEAGKVISYLKLENPDN